MKFYAIRLGIAKGTHKTEFMLYYPEIGVSERGEITYLAAPDKETNHAAHRVFEEWLMKWRRRTGERKHPLRMLDLPQELPPKQKLELSTTTARTSQTYRGPHTFSRSRKQDYVVSSAFSVILLDGVNDQMG